MWHLMPWREVKEVAEVIDLGAKKYSPDNWKTVEPERYFSACMRHLVSWKCGEKNDSETGKNHLAHAICCLLFLMWSDNEKKAQE